MKDSVALAVFEYLKRNPSSTSTEIGAALESPGTRVATSIHILYKRGAIDRKPTPNTNLDIARKTVYRYWTTTDTYERAKPGKPRSYERKESVVVPEAWDTPVRTTPVDKGIEVPITITFSIPASALKAIRQALHG